MNIQLRYYSGAGNTEVLSSEIEGEFTRRGYSVCFERITKQSNAQPPTGFDLLGVGFPVYHFRPPRLVVELLNSLDGGGRSIFFFLTKGMASGDSLRQVMTLAKERGFRTVAAAEFYYPGTDALLLFCKKGSTLEHLLKSVHSRKLQRQVNRLVEQAIHGAVISPPAQKYYHPLVAPFNDNPYQYLVEEFTVLRDRCIKCGLCVKGCPRDNIRWSSGEIAIGLECDLCLRCLHHCPTEAIQLGERTLNTVRYKPV
ncbi:EFR1 family ferrodoxin [bacterium]|nr:EFR1 family ferrodoxin [bacterium]